MDVTHKGIRVRSVRAIAAKPTSHRPLPVFSGKTDSERPRQAAVVLRTTFSARSPADDSVGSAYEVSRRRRNRQGQQDRSRHLAVRLTRVGYGTVTPPAPLATSCSGPVRWGSRCSTPPRYTGSQKRADPGRGAGRRARRRRGGQQGHARRPFPAIVKQRERASAQRSGWTESRCTRCTSPTRWSPTR